MNIRKMITLLVLVVLGFATWRYFVPKKVVEAPVVTETKTPSTSVVGATMNAKGDFEYKKETDYVEIEMTYPSKTLLANSEADAKTRAKMEHWIQGQEEYFLTQLEPMLTSEEMVRLKADGRKYAMGIDYKAYASEGHVSYVYQIYEDTGGAHPNTYYTTFTFDQSGTALDLADLFKPGARYLDRLSKLSYDYLVVDLAKRFSVKLDEDQLDWVRLGTAPSPETLQFFYLDQSNLVIIFPPYQVAAYAAGKSEVRIPLSELSELSDILK
jgi:hypothetical protein